MIDVTTILLPTSTSSPPRPPSMPYDDEDASEQRRKAQFFHRGPPMNTGILRRSLGNADAPAVRTPPPTGNEDDAENREGRERKSGGGTACKFRCLSRPLGQRYWCVTVLRGRETISKSVRRALPLLPALPPPFSAFRAPASRPARTPRARGIPLPSPLPPCAAHALRANAAQSSRPIARALHAQGLGTNAARR
ncbi:hypothetical protein B0H16DRAFT_1690873 [Mycena metata]|uniref:Uncharacterized protein n=1 Tax=Mycena metata TaxID=1033252 RepID=A0AAD7IYQ4_9AGAR|nr:hypothetical protein B0H16DRAFT_1690873 [Mycena metata]